ncbi:MAG: hypothetical protein A3K19_14610 [Lentisphaerae bacterium RIFOXYB12_FULL_65_16]|nr:MAG: hypothetical protein A3K18_28675 [Lentisphaerae bacterium RIFOXYA12_64_32]OGV87454.1 MAG: hypothetical protein A3K19_14610 [Lentisphaerae bacterium RIFOXYB12_FULL_65_16]
MVGCDKIRQVLSMLTTRYLSGDASHSVFSVRCLLLAGLLAAAWLLTPAAAAAPKLAVFPPVFEFGVQDTNRGSYSYVFLLRNEGDAKLTIKTVRASCGCTTTALGAQEIEAGKETELRGELRTASFEGEIRKSISLETSDPARPLCRLELTISLPRRTPGLRFASGNPRHLATVSGGVCTATITLENGDPKTTAHATALELPPGWTCDAKLPLAVAPGQKTVLVLTRPEKDAITTREQSILVKTDHPATPELRGSLFTIRLPVAAGR